jgi:hypothetical protein
MIPNTSETEALHRNDCMKCRNNADLQNQCLKIPANWDKRILRKYSDTKTHTQTEEDGQIEYQLKIIKVSTVTMDKGSICILSVLISIVSGTQ